jgi:hypothetical protein
MLHWPFEKFFFPSYKQIPVVERTISKIRTSISSNISHLVGKNTFGKGGKNDYGKGLGYKGGKGGKGGAGKGGKGGAGICFYGIPPFRCSKQSCARNHPKSFDELDTNQKEQYQRWLHSAGLWDKLPNDHVLKQ